MILLSDGQDQGKNADLNFKNLIASSGKSNYIFTLHALGYGSSYDAILMKKISAVAASLVLAGSFLGAKEFVTIGTGSMTGTYYPVGGAICRLVNMNKDTK